MWDRLGAFVLSGNRPTLAPRQLRIGTGHAPSRASRESGRRISSSGSRLSSLAAWLRRHSACPTPRWPPRPIPRSTAAVNWPGRSPGCASRRACRPIQTATWHSATFTCSSHPPALTVRGPRSSGSQISARGTGAALGSLRALGARLPPTGEGRVAHFDAGPPWILVTRTPHLVPDDRRRVGSRRRG